MPETIAIVPARGGSKRVPGKNLFVLASRPLVAHTVTHAVRAAEVDRTYVSTEDHEIARVAAEAGAEVVMRPPDLASDTATSESALLHVLDDRLARGLSDPALVVFLQCTSPVRTPGDIDAAVRRLRHDGADSLLSACPDPGLLWEAGTEGPRPLNYDPLHRLREQDMTPQYRENGSIYVFRPEVLRSTGSRLGGRIAIHEMDAWSSLQIDTAEDLELVSWVMRRRDPAPEWPESLDLVVFDFDGVMTDNTVFVTESGHEAVRANRGDGWGIARLRDAGVAMLVLSTEENPVVAARCAKLGVECVQGSADKGAALRALLAERGLDPSRVAYVGNDVNDLDCLRLVGLPVVVADAHPAAAAVARVVLAHGGGSGAVREFCDLVLERLRT
jgi:YrbI family 3-deoxy-D-manno-octulosonate 8-phosphate phosphatase